MALISTSIPNLVNGVSQQPAALRLSSQADEVINGFPSVVDGMRKRPGTEHIAKLTSGGLVERPYIHTIVRDKNEQYVVLLGNQDIRVFDLDGNEKTVNTPDGLSYLDVANGAQSFSAVTVADYTFIVNKEKVVSTDGTTSPSRDPEALLWVRQGSYGATYKVIVNGSTQASYKVPDGSDPSHSDDVTTDNIAAQLASQLNTNLGTNWTVARYGSTIYLKRIDGADFNVRGDDSISDTGLKVLKDRTQRFSDLPIRSVAGFQVEIAGDNTSSFGNYYVKYESASNSTDDGVWTECPKGGIEDTLDPGTMPHALVREADGTFTFKQVSWNTRNAGDNESNPLPSFVGRKVNDIFFHRNRLGLLSDENMILSRAGDYFNFFRSSATTLLDDDPIDVGVGHNKVSILRHAIPFNETLLLFSDQTQFQLGEAQILTPETISINQTTEYECSLLAKPVGVGRFVYFAVNRGNYSGIKEYYVDGETEAEEAADITSHVPQYVPSGVYKMAASTNEDTIVFISDEAPNDVYVYNFYWSNKEKIQSAWTRWEFRDGEDVLNADFIESTLFLVVASSDGVHLEKMRLEPDVVEPNWNIHVHLDRKVYETDCTVTYDPTTSAKYPYGFTTIALPYTVNSYDGELITAPGGSRKPGKEAVPEYDNSGATTVLTVPGDWSAQPFYFGTPYNFLYRFSEINIKEDSATGGKMAVGEGRLQLRKMSLLYDTAGFFQVKVRPFNRGEYTYTFSGSTLGSALTILGDVSVESGRFQFPIMARNTQVGIEIVNDSYLPCYFLSAEWEGFYTRRSKRI